MKYKLLIARTEVLNIKLHELHSKQLISKQLISIQFMELCYIHNSIIQQWAFC